MSSEDQPTASTSENDAQIDPRLAQANKLFQTGVLLIFGRKKSIDKAIKCIQKAIIFNDCNYKYWQLLGEAYYQRGSLNPAINCFIKSIGLAEKLENNNETDEDKKIHIHEDITYSKLRMSDIRLSVGHLDEAISGYSDIIENDPESVAALIGLSKAQLRIAKNCFSSNLVITGHSHCMDALKYALMATKLKPNLCLTWKLASDCCLVQFIHGQRGDFSANIDIQFPGTQDDGLKINRLTCIELAQQFLSKAITIEPFKDSACLWHNLGISLYLKSTLINDSSDSTSERELLMKRSLKCLIKSLDCDRTNSQIRNSIALVAYRLNLLNTAQSFFIKSIQTNMSTSEIQFSNLGYIYLQMGDYRLASVAFNRCQAEEPLYCRSWLGNALINEANNQDSLSLLRHCSRLENNYEAQIMYATKVIGSPHSQEYSKDIVNGLECLQNLVNYDKNSLVAQNSLGLLYEQSNHMEPARSAFDEAIKISPNESRVIFNRLRQHCASNDCSVMDLNQAASVNLDFITKAEKLIKDGNNLYHLLNYVYYLFNNRDYKSFNPMMTKLLGKLPHEDVKSKISAQILLALKAKAENDDFKSWLFKNIIDSENVCCIESVISLFSLTLLGSSLSDMQLVEQTSDDLIKYLIGYISSRNTLYSRIFNSNEGFWIQLAMVSSIFCLQSKQASKLIRPFVVLFPDVAEHWFYLSLALLFEETHKQQTQYQMALYCLKKAKQVESTNANLSVVCDILLAILISETDQVCSNDSRKSYLSRAITKCPEYRLLWEALLEQNGPRKTLGPFENYRSKKKSKRLVDEFSDGDMSLFHLAVEHTLKMVISVR